MKFKNALLIMVVMSMFSFGLYAEDEFSPEGTWVTTESEAVTYGKIHHRKKDAAVTEFHKGADVIEVKFVFDKFQGHTFHGRKVSPHHVEHFVGVMCREKKTLYFADHDGYSLGIVKDNDTIEHIYLHAGGDSRAAVINTLKREKKK